MKTNRSINLFGLSTLLTVFIVLMMSSFAIVTFLSARNEQAALKRSTTILSASYRLSSLTEEAYFAYLNELSDLCEPLESNANINLVFQQFLSTHPEIQYNNINRTLIYRITENDFSQINTLKLSQTKTDLLLERIGTVFVIDNHQDYTQNGDPIWGGK